MPRPRGPFIPLSHSRGLTTICANSSDVQCSLPLSGLTQPCRRRRPRILAPQRRLRIDEFRLTTDAGFWSIGSVMGFWVSARCFIPAHKSSEGHVHVPVFFIEAEFAAEECLPIGDSESIDSG